MKPIEINRNTTVGTVIVMDFAFVHLKQRHMHTEEVDLGTSEIVIHPEEIPTLIRALHAAQDATRKETR